MKVYNLNFKGYWREIHKEGIPTSSGVYMVYRCLYNAVENTVTPQEIIYIGQAENGNRRVVGHDKLPNFLKELKRGEELCYSFAEVDKNDLNIVENALVFMQKPRLNDELKNSYNYEDVEIVLEGQCSCVKMDNYTITKEVK